MNSSSTLLARFPRLGTVIHKGPIAKSIKIFEISSTGRLHAALYFLCQIEQERHLYRRYTGLFRNSINQCEIKRNLTRILLVLSHNNCQIVY